MKFPPLAFALAAVVSVGAALALARRQPAADVPLVTGKTLTPEGVQAPAGSFPTTLVLSPDGKWVVASSLGAKCQLTVLDAATGSVHATVEIGGKSPTNAAKKAGLYVGLAFSPDGKTLYASNGSDDRVTAYGFDDGTLTAGANYPAEKAAGLATDGRRLFVAANTGNPDDNLRSFLTVYDMPTRLKKIVDLPGYPLAVVWAQETVFVSSEQAGAVFAIDPEPDGKTRKIAVGSNPEALLIDRDGKRVFVANAGSDTVSVIDAARKRVTDTILLRPAAVRGLPSVTPLGMALSPDETTLFVACADLNAVAVVDLATHSVKGYVPVGWYPTAVAVTPDGAKLFVANAKGTAVRNVNATNKTHVIRLISGSVSTLELKPTLANLAQHTARVMANNRIAPDLVKNARLALANPGIEYVVYVVKENRTYDQVLGDLPRGDGDPRLTLFGRDVTPNQHALAERFVQMDNFYCTAEVSGTGWNVATASMANAYVERNVAYGYTDKARPYDYEGSNNGVSPDRKGIVDVGRSPGGYLWDRAMARKVSVRNYGMFVDAIKLPRKTAEEGAEGEENQANKKALVKVTNEDFRQYDLTFADSEAWVKHRLPHAPKQKPAFGSEDDPSRITTWRRDYEALVKARKVPRLMLVRLGRNHTAGTAAGQNSPRAMVADNDYAVGQLVETISHGPLWKKTAIFIVEDDAQNGYDHVDAHRSIAFVVSPFVQKGLLDSRFYNTDSALHTMECLLGLDPLTLYDATAPVYRCFGATPANDAPYTAILPAKEIIGEVNRATAYRSRDSERLINPLVEESMPDEELNDILWHAIKGVHVPAPARRYGLTAGRRDDDD